MVHANAAPPCHCMHMAGGAMCMPRPPHMHAQGRAGHACGAGWAQRSMSPPASHPHPHSRSKCSPTTTTTKLHPCSTPYLPGACSRGSAMPRAPSPSAQVAAQRAADAQVNAVMGTPGAGLATPPLLAPQRLAAFQLRHLPG